MNVFDMIGPVMIGPSSSHTAGAARLGYIARSLLGSDPVEAKITLYASFSKTYNGHGTDKAIVAGILGMKPDDASLATSLDRAGEIGLRISWETMSETPDQLGGHPNTAEITLASRERAIKMVGASIGGGAVSIFSIDGMKVNISGQCDCLIVVHNDMPGTIAAVTELIANKGINICNISLSRREKGGRACMTIEVDGVIAEDVAIRLREIDHVEQVTCLFFDPGHETDLDVEKTGDSEKKSENISGHDSVGEYNYVDV